MLFCHRETAGAKVEWEGSLNGGSARNQLSAARGQRHHFTSCSQFCARTDQSVVRNMKKSVCEVSKDVACRTAAIV